MSAFRELKVKIMKQVYNNKTTNKQINKKKTNYK